MKEPIQKEMIHGSRVALLLGLPLEQVHQICELSGLGREEVGMDGGQLVLTYEEMYRLCRLVVGPAS